MNQEERRPDQDVAMIAMEKDGGHPRRDRVVIEETRPLSKKKRWQLREILVKAEA